MEPIKRMHFYGREIINWNTNLIDYQWKYREARRKWIGLIMCWINVDMNCYRGWITFRSLLLMGFHPNLNKTENRKKKNFIQLVTSPFLKLESLRRMNLITVTILQELKHSSWWNKQKNKAIAQRITINMGPLRRLKTQLTPKVKTKVVRANYLRI